MRNESSPLRITRLLTVATFSLICAALLTSKDLIEKPFDKWDRGEVAKIFSDSAWAQSQTYTSVIEGGYQGQNEAQYKFVVRLFSALPIREAYVRMLQIMNRYDDMAPDKRKQFDSGANGLLTANLNDEIIVALAFSTNLPEATRDVQRFLDTATTQTLNQQAFLFSPRAGRLDLKKYLPPGQEGIGARFIFPRSLKGQPVLAPGDKELRFEVWVSPINQRVLVGFKPSKMMYKGEIAY
jgi:hypothetical protein